jgi:hypothetical protein
VTTSESTIATLRRDHIKHIQQRVEGLTTAQLEAVRLVVDNASDFERFIWLLGQFAKNKSREKL